MQPSVSSPELHHLCKWCNFVLTAILAASMLKAYGLSLFYKVSLHLWSHESKAILTAVFVCVLPIRSMWIKIFLHTRTKLYFYEIKIGLWNINTGRLWFISRCKTHACVLLLNYYHGCFFIWTHIYEMQSW